MTFEVSNDFTIAGLEIEFSKLRLDRNQVKLEDDFTLPNALGAFDISLSAPNALIISNDDIRIEGGNISFPTAEFRLFDSFEIKAEDAAIGYFPVNDEIKIQGKFALVTPFFRSDPNESSGASIVLDISGSNYLKISDGLADINGDFSLKNIGLGDRWSINELTLSLTAENGELQSVGGKADIVFPWNPDNLFASNDTNVVITAEFLTPPATPNLELNELIISADNLDLPLGATGLLFQYILGGVKNVAPSSTLTLFFLRM